VCNNHAHVDRQQLPASTAAAVPAPCPAQLVACVEVPISVEQQHCQAPTVRPQGVASSFSDDDDNADAASHVSAQCTPQSHVSAEASPMRCARTASVLRSTTTPSSAKSALVGCRTGCFLLCSGCFKAGRCTWCWTTLSTISTAAPTGLAINEEQKSARRLLSLARCQKHHCGRWAQQHPCQYLRRGCLR